MSGDAVTDLPVHLERCQRLLRLVVEQLGGLPYPDGDHYAFMALCFLSKQMEHAESILLLRARRDATLVARTMMEGVVQLLWAGKHPVQRGLQWRGYAAVSDWRLMKARQLSGDAPDLETVSSVERALAAHGDRYFTPRAHTAKACGQPLPHDPYYPTWRCESSLREIFEQSDLRSVYEGRYAEFSDWHHWGVTGLGKAIHRGDDHIRYSPDSIESAATAVEIAFHALLVTAQIAFGYLDHPVCPRLESFEKEYLEWKRGGPN